MDEIIKKIEDKGYVVVIKNGITIYEPYTSDITGETFNQEIAMTTKKDDVKFMQEVLDDL